MYSHVRKSGGGISGVDQHSPGRDVGQGPEKMYEDFSTNRLRSASHESSLLSVLQC